MDDSFALIDSLLEEPASELVRAFYDKEFAAVHSNRADFIGEIFTTLGATDPDQFEPADLIAVHLMGMDFTPTATSALLNPGPERDEVSKLLVRIPHVDIWSDDADFSAANELWTLLVEGDSVYKGIGWVTAGKLLARKRPALIPVIDEVITTLLPRAESDYWILFQNYLRADGRVEKVEALRPDGIAASNTPTLRLLDTALWMRGSGGPAKEIRSAFDLID